MKAEPTYYSSLVLYPEHIVLRMCKMIQCSTHIGKHSVITQILNCNSSHQAHTALSHSYCSLWLPPPSHHLHHCRYNWGCCHPPFFNLPTSSGFPPFPVQSGSGVPSCQPLLFAHSLPLCFSYFPFFLSWYSPFPFSLIFSLASVVLRTPTFSASHFVAALCLFTWLPQQPKC